MGSPLLQTQCQPVVMVPSTLLTVILLIPGISAQSCEGRCDDPLDPNQPCQCNAACVTYHDCCDDYSEICQGDDNSCKGKCGAAYQPSLPCQCNDLCSNYHNCCSDYEDECPPHHALSDAELVELGQLLIQQDDANVAGLYQLNLQCSTHDGSTEDCSPEPLFTSVDPAVFQLPVYVKLAALYDNYVKSPGTVEDHTEQEQAEEMDFLDEVLSSAVMQTTYNFLFEKSAFTGTFEDWGRHVYDTWFGMYDRARTILGSSGFEHVFIGEVKKGQVSGFHNWFHWHWLEKEGHINYLGYWEHVTLGNQGDRGDGLSFTFTWDGVQKPYGSAFIGTSPSLELAVYTTCLLARPDTKCHMVLGDQDVYIQTWRTVVGSQVYVGSSYPDWSL